ncbi:MAG: ABC transporter permease [Verrucomicrobiaceae bacterium]|nr:ABC transporter permease [Verrucomicrobiaceae bacterium]
MNTVTLVTREILHRRWSFVLGILAVSISVFCLLGSLAVLESFDRVTDEKLGEMNAETETILKGHEDAIRKAMKGLGFNIHIYPEGQDLSEIYSKGYGMETMPEDYVKRLADSDIVTVNHLLPRLTQMVEWPEGETSVLLFGVRGEEPIAFRGPQKKGELIDPVGVNEIALGYELHHRRNISAGDQVEFRGRKFKVARAHERRGGIDDITAWVSLTVVQEMLGKPGKINSILALECNCESLDRLGEVTKEIKSILPNTQVIEVESKALARAQARNGAKSLRLQEKEKFLQNRESLRQVREGFANFLVVLVALLSLVCITYLTASNVRERILEVGTLCAIGIGFNKVLQVMLSRAILMGFFGAMTSIVLVFLCGKLFLRGDVFDLIGLDRFSWLALMLSVPFMSGAAAWLPAFFGARRAPAEVLSND